MFTSKLFYIFILLLVILLTLVWQMTAYKVEEPNYNLVKAENNIQIREYPAMLIAQVNVKGERYDALNAGFKKLAKFIFRDNRKDGEIAMTAPVMQQSQKIAMTAPVMQQSQKIAMTAPVTQQVTDGEWQVRFVMPAKYKLETLPKPVDDEIKLIEVPAKKYAVIRFAGFNSQSNLVRYEAQLNDYLSRHHIKRIGQAIYAFYNPPWILPFLRRNEIMIEIQ